MKFLKAVLILSGMIIGVGMFAIPFSFSVVGFWLGLVEFCVIAGVVLTLHLLYGEVVLATRGSHRLPGYVQLHLGKTARTVASISAVVGMSGILLAYLVVGSSFLKGIAQHVTQTSGIASGSILWVGIMVVIGGLVTRQDLKRESIISGFLAALLIFCILLLVSVLLPAVHLDNLTEFHPERALFPYGIFLFALSGGVVVPDVIAVLGRKRIRSRAAVALGTLIPATLYVLFAFVVVGAAGSSVSPETISGLQTLVGTPTLLLLQIIGFLAVFTAMMALSESLQELFEMDLRFSSNAAWVIAWGVPVALYITGFHDFIRIISLVGAVAAGIDSALIIAMYTHIRQRGSHRGPVWRWILYGIILLGVIYELLRFLAV